MKPILLVADNNYFRPLVAQINSIVCNVKDSKIYLIHDLSESNLEKIIRYVDRAEKFNPAGWEHMQDNQQRYVTKTVLGKWQVDFIDEEQFVYLDTDVIIHKDFEWETPITMFCEMKPISLLPKKYLRTVQLMRDYIQENQGVIEEKLEDTTIISDGGYFGNKPWILNILKPKIVNCSHEMPQDFPNCWYGMGFFQAAIGLLGRPIAEWLLKQALPYLEPQEIVEKAELLHFTGTKKPWDFLGRDYPYQGAEIWWNYYKKGPIILK